MRHAVGYGTAIVLAHLAVNIIHGAAHHELHVELGPSATIFVIVVILLCPLIAMVLLWASQERLGLVLLTVSMAVSLIFGLYNHFVEISPDHVGKQAPSSWGTAFVLTAYLLVLAEAIGTFIGLCFLYRSTEYKDSNGEGTS